MMGGFDVRQGRQTRGKKASLRWYREREKREREPDGEMEEWMNGARRCIFL